MVWIIVQSVILSLRIVDGGIDEYYDELAIPPDAISSLASSQTTTGASVSSIGDLADYTYGANNDRSVTITGKATTKTVAFTWTRNSSINDAVGFEWNNGGYSALAANSTGKSVTSVTDISFDLIRSIHFFAESLSKFIFYLSRIFLILKNPFSFSGAF